MSASSLALRPSHSRIRTTAARVPHQPIPASEREPEAHPCPIGLLTAHLCATVVDVRARPATCLKPSEVKFAVKMAKDGLKGADIRAMGCNEVRLDRPRSTLLLLPSCPLHWQMRGRAPLWSSAAHLPSTRSRSTCSLVYFLIAFLSISRSSPHHRLRAVPPQHICTRTARVARASAHCSPSSLLLVVEGQLSVAWCDARDLCGPM